MPQPSEHELLFAVTAMQLKFATEEQIAAATDSLQGGSTLRDLLIKHGVLDQSDAEAINAVVKQRLARSEGDASDAIERSGAHDTYAPGDADSLSGPDPFQTIDQPTTARSHSQRYHVLRVHQQGGLGRVSVANDVDFDREIALKEILPHRADDPEHRRRFVREAEITGALEHPGVVPVYSLGEHDDGRPYYAMRFIRGVDMQQACDDYHKRTPAADRPLRFRQLLASFVDVCQTMHYAHSRGVLHRDLKPSNIMLGDYGESLVVDWGLAKASGESHSADDLAAPPVNVSGKHVPYPTHAGKVVGTPAYMSPEQAEGRIDLLTAATDIYGLGATLYHLMTGVPPFEGDDMRMLNDVRQGRFRKPSEMAVNASKPLEAICLKAMGRQPSDRYATAGELALDIERYLADEPVAAYQEPLAVRFGRWSRRNRGLVLSFISTATVAIVLLTGSVALLTAANSRERTARLEANTNAAEADKQRQQAEQNFALARQAVQDYYVTVSEETLLRERGMHPLRDALLGQALTYYKQFLATRGDDESLQSEVALAHFYTGQITETIDSPDAALPHYDRAIALQTPLAESNDAIAVTLARTTNARGRALQKLSRLPEAAEAFANAAGQRRTLAEAEPTDSERARELANSVMNLAVVKLQQGDAASALGELQRAQALRRAHAVDSKQAEGRLGRDLAQGDYNLAIAHLQVGQAQESLTALERAAETFARIATASPRDGDNQARLANTLRMMAALRRNFGANATATAHFREAAETLEKLVSRNPDVVDYAGDLAGVRMDLAQHLASTGDPVAAEEEIARAVATLEALGPSTMLPPRRRRDLGAALRFWGTTFAKLDRPDKALEKLRASLQTLQQLVRDKPGDPKDLDELAATEAAIDQLSVNENGTPNE